MNQKLESILKFRYMLLSMAAAMLMTLQSALAVGEPAVTYCRFVPERIDDFAWENDKVAFRAYGPAARPGTEDSGFDCWLKRVEYSIIDNWYLAGEYHADHGEGCDPYHVGDSRGCGGLGLWIDDQLVTSDTYTAYEILTNGPAVSSFILTYEWDYLGDTYKEEKKITINLGDRLFTAVSTFWKNDQLAVGLPIAVGITTHGGLATITRNVSAGWMSCWEKINEPDDENDPTAYGVGTGVIMEPTAIIAYTNAYDHALFITKTDARGQVAYHTGYGWEKAGEITTSLQWQNYLREFSKPEIEEFRHDGSSSISFSFNGAASKNYIIKTSSSLTTNALDSVVIPLSATTGTVSNQMIKTTTEGKATVQLSATNSTGFFQVKSRNIATMGTLPTRADIIATGRLVNDYWLANAASMGEDLLNAEWNVATYYAGNQRFYEITGERAYLDQAIAWGTANQWLRSEKSKFNGNVVLNDEDPDNHCCGQTYIDLYNIDPRPVRVADIIRLEDYIVSQESNGFLSWIDTFFMQAPTMAKLSAIANSAAYSDKFHAMYTNTKVDQNLFDATEGLWFRDSKYIYPAKTTSGGNKVFWARGNGWMIAGLVRAIEALQESDPHRAEYISMVQTMAAKLITLQQADGFWRSSLLEPTQFDMPETSGTSFYTYAIAWCVNNGILDRATYLPHITLAWDGLVNEAVHTNGFLGYVQLVAAEPGSSFHEDTKAYGVGAFLLAASEMSLVAGESPVEVEFPDLPDLPDPPPPHPSASDLVAGWDVWNNPTSPTANALMANVTATAVTTSGGSAWHVTDERGASNDGTWGTYAGPPAASANVVDGECMELPNAATGGTMTFTITNNGTEDIELNAFHFDAYAFRPKAARTYELSVLAGGGITDGVIYTSSAQEITSVGGANDNDAHDDIDHSLLGLADHTLAAGESARFLLAFSGGAGDGSGGHDLWVDNVGVSPVIAP